jgi:hypothetical protein
MTFVQPSRRSPHSADRPAINCQKITVENKPVSNNLRMRSGLEVSHSRYFLVSWTHSQTRGVVRFVRTHPETGGLDDDPSATRGSYLDLFNFSIGSSGLVALHIILSKVRLP